MLSASLQLYFKTLENKLCAAWEEDKRKKAFKNGFLRGYKTLFVKCFIYPGTVAMRTFSLLEQVISTMGVRHTTKDLQKFPQPFFASEIEKILFAEIGQTPPVHVAPEMLFAAIKEVDTLAEWLEERLLAVRYRR